MMENSLEKTHFLEYWRVLQSRKEIVIAVVFALLVAGWLITLSMPKEYMAYTRITVKSLSPDVDPFKGQREDLRYDPFYLKTQIEVIKSKLVLDPVVSNLSLQATFSKAAKLPRSLTESEARLELLRSIRATSLLDTSMIKIEVYRKAPQETVTKDVKEIANEIARVYAEVSTVVERERVQGGLAKLETELERYNKQVVEKEAEREKLRKEFGIISFMTPRKDFGAEGDPTTRIRIQVLEDSRIVARKRMTECQVKMEKIQNLSGDPLLYTLVGLVQDQNLSILRRDMAEAERRLKDLQETHGENHPDVVRQNAVIMELKKQVNEALTGAKTALQTDHDIARRNLEMIEKDLAEEKKNEISGSSEKYQPYNKVCEQLEDLKKFRDALQISASKEVVGLEIPQTPVRVVDYAEEPDRNAPVGPSLILNMIFSMILGLGCGVGLAFFIEYVDASIKNIDEIERYVGAPVLGIVPQKVKSLIQDGEDSPHAEIYRVLRTNIQFSKKLGKGRTLCITSGGAGEGKSFTISNLACVCAHLNEKVLVIDSDLRRPRQHKIFNIDRQPGLADLLTGEATLEQAIRTTSVPNLWLLPSGRTSIGATGLLDTERMRDILDYLKGQFDWVFLDAPPIVGISDASVLANKVDGVLLVIQYRNYPRELPVRAKQIIDNVGGNLLGVVFNNINMTRDSYYYHHYYRYYSDAYGYGRNKSAKKASGIEKPGARQSGEEIAPKNWKV
ncbi:MAG: polysaccharide biosynthesis tyrosine autokinase [bacterium]